MKTFKSEMISLKEWQFRSLGQILFYSDILFSCVMSETVRQNDSAPQYEYSKSFSCRWSSKNIYLIFQSWKQGSTHQLMVWSRLTFMLHCCEWRFFNRWVRLFYIRLCGNTFILCTQIIVSQVHWKATLVEIVVKSMLHMADIINEKITWFLHGLLN